MEFFNIEMTNETGWNLKLKSWLGLDGTPSTHAGPKSNVRYAMQQARRAENARANAQGR